MTYFLPGILILFGLSIEVYFILILLGIPIFFFLRWLFKKYVKADKERKILMWLVTIIVTPGIYMGFVLLWVFTSSYYPSHNFDKQKWFNEQDKRYELSQNIIESKMLIGKSKAEVRELLGDETNNDSLNVWTFGLGIRPELFNIDGSYLLVNFVNDQVVSVEQIN